MTTSSILTTSARTLPETTADEPGAYHRLARIAHPRRWWRPVLVLGTAATLYLGIVLALLVPAVGVGLAVPGIEATIDRMLSLETMNEPVSLALTLLAIALLLPATLLAVRLAGRRPVGTLWSVAGRLRPRLLGRAALVTAAALGVLGLVSMAIGPESAPGPAMTASRLLLSLIAVVLLVPFQAAAEEVVFRGLLMQTVGAWLRHPAWAILLPLPLFVVGHTYSALGLADVAVFALVAGYLTWRTGGLEAAIGVHVVNNLGAFGIALITGADLDATEIAPQAALLSVAYTVATAAVILTLHRRDEARARTR